MKKTYENKKLNFLANVIGNTAFAIVFWPFINFVICTLIYKQKFTYSVIEYVFGPIVYGITLTCLTAASKKITKKN